jgi:uncharacterized protein YrrD
MPRGHDLIGLPVHQPPTMRTIGTLQDALLAPDLTRIVGFSLTKAGLFRRRPHRVLAWAAIKALRPTHLVAEADFIEVSDGPVAAMDLRGRPVLGPDRSEAGFLDDIHFDPITGRIIALQLSHGLVDDLFQGKGLVAVDGPLMVWDDLICFPAPEQMAEPEPGGVL